MGRTEAVELRRRRGRQRSDKSKSDERRVGAPKGTIVTHDLHGLTAEDARSQVAEVIREADRLHPPPEYIEFIHGFNRGRVLRAVVEAVASGMGKRWHRNPANDGATFVEL